MTEAEIHKDMNESRSRAMACFTGPRGEEPEPASEVAARAARSAAAMARDSRQFLRAGFAEAAYRDFRGRSGALARATHGERSRDATQRGARAPGSFS